LGSLPETVPFPAKESTRVEYGKILAELGKEHPEIVVLDADLSGSTQTARFAKVFQDRFFNVGIAEQDMMGTAAGLALGGLIPFASTFAIFATGRAWEQVRQTIAYGNLNVKIVASHGGITVGEDGGSHQAIEDLALMRVLPNLAVLVPADGPEVRAMVRWAVPPTVRFISAPPASPFRLSMTTAIPLNWGGAISCGRGTTSPWRVSASWCIIVWPRPTFWPNRESPPGS